MNSSLIKLIPELLNTEKIKTLCGNTTFVGIDFGTSNTVVSICGWNENSQEIILKELDLDRLVGGEPTHLIPTVLFVDDERLLIGQNAKIRGRKNGVFGCNYLSSFKMELGYDAGPKYHQFNLARKPELRASVVNFLDELLGDREKGITNETMSIDSPQKATEAFFRLMRGFIEKHCEKIFPERKIKYSVSIPACFGANQRREYKQALGAAGIDVKDQFFIDEPNAAFLSWMTEFEGECEEFENSNLMVFDFGAGTCDISILASTEDPNSNTLKLKNLSISRFSALGGRDLDREIAAKLLFPKVCECNELDPVNVSPIAYRNHFEHTLTDIAERMKLSISRRLARENLRPDFLFQFQQDEIHKISMPGNWWDRLFSSKKREYISVPPEFSFTIGEFENLVQYLIENRTQPTKGKDAKWFNIWNRLFSRSTEDQKIFDLIKNALEKSNLQQSQIHRILFIGGSSNLRVVQDAIANYFDDQPEIILPQDLQSHVSKGVAFHSFLSHGLKSNPITEILAEDIYLLIKGGEKLVFKAGTEIPASASVGSLYRPEKSPRRFEMPFLTGENRRLISKISAKLPPKISKYDEITLEAEIDISKIIHLNAKYEGGILVENEELSPFANESIDKYRQQCGKLLAQLHALVLKEGFITGEDSLSEPGHFTQSSGVFLELVRLHSQQGNFSECLILHEEYMPDEYTNMGFYASRMGESELSARYMKKAYDSNPSGITAYNLALEFERESLEHRKYLEESVTYNFIGAKYLLSKLIDAEHSERSKKLYMEAEDHYRTKFELKPNELSELEYARLEEIAESSDDLELMHRIQKTLAKKKSKTMRMASKVTESHLLEAPNMGRD